MRNDQYHQITGQGFLQVLQSGVETSVNTRVQNVRICLCLILASCVVSSANTILTSFPFLKSQNNSNFSKCYQKSMKWLDEILWFNEQEFEQILGDGEGQGSLACCTSWSHRVGHD